MVSILFYGFQTALEAKRSGEPSANEIHNFYQSQLETILGEKIRSLQSHVEELEKSFVREKEESLSLQTQEQDIKTQKMKEK